MRPTLYSVKRAGSGRLSTMARPRGNDWLPDEMNGLREAGTDVLVSMLTSDESEELDLQGEAEAATAAGLVFLACPTPARRTGNAKFRDLLAELRAGLDARQNVVVHCRMGIGRSSLVAAGLLVSEGQTVPEAFKAISTARGMAVPDTDAQRTWLQAVMSDTDRLPHNAGAGSPRTHGKSYLKGRADPHWTRRFPSRLAVDVRHACPPHSCLFDKRRRGAQLYSDRPHCFRRYIVSMCRTSPLD